MLKSKKYISTLFILMMTLFATPAFAQAYWGALALNLDTGIAGGAWDYASEGDAIEGALDACVRNHKGRRNNCVNIVSFYNGCAALYWSPVNKTYGYGIDSVGTNNALARAYKSCEEKGGKNCEEVKLFCTTRILY